MGRYSSNDAVIVVLTEGSVSPDWSIFTLRLRISCIREFVAKSTFRKVLYYTIDGGSGRRVAACVKLIFVRVAPGVLSRERRQ